MITSFLKVHSYRFQRLFMAEGIFRKNTMAGRKGEKISPDLRLSLLSGVSDVKTDQPGNLNDEVDLTDYSFKDNQRLGQWGCRSNVSKTVGE